MLKKLTIEDLEWTSRVICIDGMYSGLLGYVSHILSGDEKETENEGEHEIYVDFEEVEFMDELYSDLNGTGVDQLVMDIEELALVDEEEITAIDVNGNIHMISNLIRKN